MLIEIKFTKFLKQISGKMSQIMGKKNFVKTNPNKQTYRVVMRLSHS